MKKEQHNYVQDWVADFEDTDVWAERVIRYYSHHFRKAEVQYSAME